MKFSDQIYIARKALTLAWGFGYQIQCRPGQLAAIEAAFLAQDQTTRALLRCFFDDRFSLIAVSAMAKKQRGETNELVDFAFTTFATALVTMGVFTKTELGKSVKVPSKPDEEIALCPLCQTHLKLPRRNKLIVVCGCGVPFRVAITETQRVYQIDDGALRLPRTLLQCHLVLGVPREAPFGEVKRVYLQKIKRVHPDLHWDKPPRTQEIAAKLSLIFNLALQKIESAHLASA